MNYGNKLDISEVELLEALAGNEDLRVVVMYVEGLKYPGEGRRLLEVMRRVTKVKPVIVYKAGRSKSSGRAVKSHTAAWRVITRSTGQC